MRACGRGPVPERVAFPRAPRRAPGTGGMLLSVVAGGRRGRGAGGRGKDQLASALLGMLVTVKLASGSKKGAQGRGGGDVCSLALTSAGGRGRDPPPRPCAQAGRGRGGGAGPWGGGAPGRPAAGAAPAAGRMPLSRSVKLNKEGICVFLTSAGYLIHKLMYNSLWVFLKCTFIMLSTRVFMFNYFKNNFFSRPIPFFFFF